MAISQARRDLWLLSNVQVTICPGLVRPWTYKYFGPVIPIAAFFYLGDAGFTQIIGDHLPVTSHGIVNDLGVGLVTVVPLTKEIAVITLAVVGAITGLDGSGFSGISLAGSVGKFVWQRNWRGYSNLNSPWPNYSNLGWRWDSSTYIRHINYSLIIPHLKFIWITISIYHKSQFSEAGLFIVCGRLSLSSNQL